MDRNEILLLAGGGVAVVAAVAIAGRASKTGAVGIGPNPAAVASIQTAAVQEIQSYNQTAADRAKTAAGAIVALAGLQEAQNVAAITEGASTQRIAITDSGSTSRAQIAADASVKTTDALTKASEIIAQYQSDTAKFVASQAPQIAQINANAAQTVAATQADASKVNTQTTSNVQKTQANLGFWGNLVNGVLGTVGKIFGF
jgi:hypothetical protein